LKIETGGNSGENSGGYLTRFPFRLLFCSHHTHLKALTQNMPRAEFVCGSCRNKFTTAAERTSDFTVDCHQCGCRVRPKAFLPEVVEPAPRRPQCGVARFVCASCGNTFTSHAERSSTFTCLCYRCDRNVRPAEFVEGGLRRRTNSGHAHSCIKCKGLGRCHVVAASRGSARAR
jgi:hypothetical protein